MKIYLAQHGEAAAKEVDPDRPLTQTGINDVVRIAEALARADIRVTRVVHSGKLRARQTADIMIAALSPGVEAETSEKMDPTADPAAFDLDGGIDADDTLLVGHLPFMSRLVSHLVAGNGEIDLVAYRPGSVVCVETTASGAWRIAWMLRADLAAGLE